jgi:hypothetical protein
MARPFHWRAEFFLIEVGSPTTANQHMLRGQLLRPLTEHIPSDRRREGREDKILKHVVELRMVDVVMLTQLLSNCVAHRAVLAKLLGIHRFSPFAVGSDRFSMKLPKHETDCVLNNI